MKFDEWHKANPEFNVVSDGGRRLRVFLPNERPFELWNLDDYCVSASVSGPSIILTPRAIELKVFAISNNRNAFGLSGVILMARDGSSWEIGVNLLSGVNTLSIGDTLRGVPDGSDPGLVSGLAYEIPRRLKTAPPEIISALWGSPARS